MAKGTLNADELKVAKITVNVLTNPIKFPALFALVDNKTGRTVAWTSGDSGKWSNETMTHFKSMCESMERDIANDVMDGVSDSVSTKAPPNVGGLAEHLGTGDGDAPSI